MMQTNRLTRFIDGRSPWIVGLLLIAVTVVPFVGTTAAGALSGRGDRATPNVTFEAHVTRDCGPITFEWSAGQPVTYFQVHATGVSCAVAKTVIVKGGKYRGEPPKGWTFVGTINHGPNCDSTYRRGKAVVTGYMVNTQGC